ncbi:hypothetical protein ACRARG_20370 [Pseudooceanicola sp. C21-150M6]|uniref:hypothetical protein n=1 Tax=Pseudooceanicola sp. C21-150M6 TaxID=3434355 RepID=UPI003D7FA390
MSTATGLAPQSPVISKGIVTALIANLIWINASEVFRYFVFVMPMMRAELPMVPDVAPMNLPVFLIWGVWDTILIGAAVFFQCLMFDRYGLNARTAILAGSLLWLGIFGILWLGLWNMNLTSLSILAVALPLAWAELLISALLTRWCLVRHR